LAINRRIYDLAQMFPTPTGGVVIRLNPLNPSIESTASLVIVGFFILLFAIGGLLCIVSLLIVRPFSRAALAGSIVMARIILRFYFLLQSYPYRMGIPAMMLTKRRLPQIQQLPNRQYAY
jgi:hypothetical protein